MNRLVIGGDDDLERLILARSPRFQALLEKSRKSIKAGKGLSPEDFWQAVAERQNKKKKPSRFLLKRQTNQRVQKVQ